MTAKFTVFKSTANSQYYFSLKAPNGEKILASEGYTTKQSCLNGINSVKVNSPSDTNYKRLSSANGQYYFTLNSAHNAQVVGVSEMYTTIQWMNNGIESVKKYAQSAVVVEIN